MTTIVEEMSDEYASADDACEMHNGTMGTMYKVQCKSGRSCEKTRTHCVCHKQRKLRVSKNSAFRFCTFRTELSYGTVRNPVKYHLQGRVYV